MVAIDSRLSCLMINLELWCVAGTVEGSLKIKKIRTFPFKCHLGIFFPISNLAIERLTEWATENFLVAHPPNLGLVGGCYKSSFGSWKNNCSCHRASAGK